MSEKLFVGKRKVSTFVENKDINLVAVKFADGGTDEYTLEQWAAVQSPEQYPDQEVSRRKWSPATSAILQVLLDNNLRIYEKDFILNLVDSSIVENYNRAIAMIFGVKDPTQVRVDQLDLVLKQGSTAMNEDDDEEMVDVPKEESLDAPLPHPSETGTEQEDTKEAE